MEARCLVQKCCWPFTIRLSRGEWKRKTATRHLFLVCVSIFQDGWLSKCCVFWRRRRRYNSSKSHKFNFELVTKIRLSLSLVQSRRRLWSCLVNFAISFCFLFQNCPFTTFDFSPFCKLCLSLFYTPWIIATLRKNLSLALSLLGVRSPAQSVRHASIPRYVINEPDNDKGSSQKPNKWRGRRKKEKPFRRICLCPLNKCKKRAAALS